MAITLQPLRYAVRPKTLGKYLGLLALVIAHQDAISELQSRWQS